MKNIKLIILIIFIILSFGTNAYCRVSSKDLTSKAISYDNSTIEFQGEVVGDIMLRGDFGWINVLESKTAIGVWVNKTDIEKIKSTGDYFHKGDIIIITGIFHRSCQIHGGDMDIHANSIEIVKPGKKIDHPIDKKKYAIIILLTVISIVLFLIYKSGSKT